MALQSGLITDLITDHKQGPYTDHSMCFTLAVFHFHITDIPTPYIPWQQLRPRDCIAWLATGRMRFPAGDASHRDAKYCAPSNYYSTF